MRIRDLQEVESQRAAAGISTASTRAPERDCRRLAGRQPSLRRTCTSESDSSTSWQRRDRPATSGPLRSFSRCNPTQPAITTAGLLPKSMAGNTIDGRLLRNGPHFSDLQPFFHWPLEFPEVFADGGFDAILSNPPWERIKLQGAEEFFAVRDERIASAPYEGGTHEAHPGFVRARTLRLSRPVC